MSSPDDLLTRDEVLTVVNQRRAEQGRKPITMGTLAGYVNRRQAPQPVDHVGRTPVWRRGDIDEWDLRATIREESGMATTTYGTWNNHGDRSHVRVEDTVAVYLGEFAGDYDFDGLVAAYRAAINDALPEGVSLRGDEFYGPHPKDYDLELPEAIESDDLGALAEQYDKTAKESQP